MDHAGSPRLIKSHGFSKVCFEGAECRKLEMCSQHGHRMAYVGRGVSEGHVECCDETERRESELAQCGWDWSVGSEDG